MRFVVTGDTYNKQMTKAMGDWLDSYPWQWFVTLTFAEFSTNVNRARKLFDGFIETLNEDVIYFVAIEWNQFGDCVHIHALLGAVEEEIKWDYGIAKIIPYEKDKGARYYVAKFISSKRADWDLKV